MRFGDSRFLSGHNAYCEHYSIGKCAKDLSHVSRKKGVARVGISNALVGVPAWGREMAALLPIKVPAEPNMPGALHRLSRFHEPSMKRA